MHKTLSIIFTCDTEKNAESWYLTGAGVWNKVLSRRAAGARPCPLLNRISWLARNRKTLSGGTDTILGEASWQSLFRVCLLGLLQDTDWGLQKVGDAEQWHAEVLSSATSVRMLFVCVAHQFLFSRLSYFPCVHMKRAAACQALSSAQQPVLAHSPTWSVSVTSCRANTGWGVIGTPLNVVLTRVNTGEGYWGYFSDSLLVPHSQDGRMDIIPQFCAYSFKNLYWTHTTC